MSSTSSLPASGGHPLSRAGWNRRHAGAGLAWTAEPNCLVQMGCGSLPRALDLAAGEGRNPAGPAARGRSVHTSGFPERARGASNACVRAAAEAA
ncbi:hypothetical protein [Pseudoduganella rhizocola]|uniref:hypothetical protein n=1 Tax=Pseudoduganella rhizocola TaxID=3382643 RepID=UPI0038B6A857